MTVRVNSVRRCSATRAALDVRATRAFRYATRWYPLRARPRLVTLLVMALTACVDPTNHGTGGDDRRGVRTRGSLSLREVAQARGLRVGAAVDKLFRDDADGVEFKAVLSEEFSVMTPENDMKHRKLQPSRGV